MNTRPHEPTIQELFDLTGRTALITGGTGYLGGCFSRALAEAGACVVIASSRGAQVAQEAADALPSPRGVKHLGVRLDHMDESLLNAGFDQAVSLAGKIDILINNGLDKTGHPIHEVTAEEFSRHMINNTGYFLLARRLRDHVVQRGATGSIIMIGSMYGVVGSYPEAYEGVACPSPVTYHALKGGTIHMTRHLAVYWAADRVRVNCLSPGPFPTPQINPEMVRRLCTKSPMKRMGQPWELKGTLLLLASDAGSYITGQNILIDGGWTAW